MYGQELAEEIAKRRGEKPNPGTIYPALQHLKKQGLVLVMQEGRKTVYGLTDEGRTGIVHARAYFMHAYGEILLTPSPRRK